MIQRIQSLYLLAAILCSCLLFFSSIAMISTSVHVYSYSIRGLMDQSVASSLLMNTFSMLLLNSSIGIIAFITIFLFKKRLVQIRLIQLNILLLVVFLALAFYFFESAIEQVSTIEKLAIATTKTISYSFGAVLPIIQLIFLWMAIRSISKDEELVRSADRIR